MNGSLIRELGRRSMQKYDNTLRLLRYINRVCYVSNTNAVFQCFRCPNCDTFSSRTFKLERHLTTCSERVKNIYPCNIYKIQETFFHKLDSFGIKNTSQRKPFKILEFFNFESICVQEESFKDTKTTTWIGKQVPVSKSTFSNLVEEPTFLYNSNPHRLLSSFIGKSGIANKSTNETFIPWYRDNH